MPSRNWLETTRNDLEPAARKMQPAIGAAAAALDRAGSGFTRMSGSGATCFGLFETGNVAKRAAIAIRARHPGWFVAATRSSIGGRSRWAMTKPAPFVPVGIAVLTVSDTRTLEDDKSGQTLADRIADAGHMLAGRAIVTDDAEKIRETVLAWSRDEKIDVVITTGGTGFTGRDVTPEALEPIFEKRMDGFSEVFHRISYDKIGTSTIQSQGDRRRRQRHLRLRAAGFARRLQGRLGRHFEGPARLPPHALQFRRDHAAARRAFETRRRRA